MVHSFLKNQGLECPTFRWRGALANSRPSALLSTLKLNQEGVIKRILVHVDDYAMMREIVNTSLRSDGC